MVISAIAAADSNSIRGRRGDGGGCFEAAYDEPRGDARGTVLGRGAKDREDTSYFKVEGCLRAV